ncbi:MAG TPA: multidrug effflux MFS transporter, partial [Xanthobacteraceae bacterium]|nr:multidrug effflux MFS transporter [Xanthobacteraceae bacterium]
LTVYVYMIAFALAQIAYGPISDMVGRRPALLVGLAIFAAGSVAGLAATSFNMLLAARAVQGIGSAAARVLAVTIVRDRFAGREMARVMSLTMMVFLIVPIFAPTIGSLLLVLGGWRTIFAATLGLGLVLAVWFAARMPETLHPEYRFPLSFARVGAAVTLTVSTRVSIGYATAVGLMMGCLMAYIGSAQQILETTVYGLGPVFTLYFGLIAALMGVGSLVNSRLVRRVGMRRMGHAGLCGFVLVSFAQLGGAIVFAGHPPLAWFVATVALNLMLFSLTVPNFNAMAMEPLGAVAGTASSLIGAYTTLAGALCGLAVGQAFDGTVTPLAAGFVTLSLCCLAVVTWAERGKLFVPRSAPPGGKA